MRIILARRYLLPRHSDRPRRKEQRSALAAVIQGGHLRSAPDVYSKYENINYRQHLLVTKENKQHSLCQTQASTLRNKSTQRSTEAYFPNAFVAILYTSLVFVFICCKCTALVRFVCCLTTLFKLQIKANGTCSMHGRDDKCIQSFNLEVM